MHADVRLLSRDAATANTAVERAAADAVVNFYFPLKGDNYPDNR